MRFWQLESYRVCHCLFSHHGSCLFVLIKIWISHTVLLNISCYSTENATYSKCKNIMLIGSQVEKQVSKASVKKGQCWVAFLEDSLWKSRHLHHPYAHLIFLSLLAPVEVQTATPRLIVSFDLSSLPLLVVAASVLQPYSGFTSCWTAWGHSKCPPLIPPEPLITSLI